MKNLFKMLLMKPEGDGSGGGGATGYKSDEATSANTETVTPPEGGGDNVDDFGYDTPAEDKPKKGEKPAEPPKEEGIKDPATGYGDKEPEVPKAEEKPAEPPKEEVEPKPTDEFKVTDKGDLLDTEVSSIESFAKKHKLSKEAAEDLVALKKAEVKAAMGTLEQQKQQAKIQTQETRRGWYNELKSDPDFGGEKFNHSIHRAEKVLQEFFPGLKKQLTDHKGMLPPYVMKDLKKLGDHLYSSVAFTKGDPIVDESKNDKSDDPLAYYE